MQIIQNKPGEIKFLMVLLNDNQDFHCKQFINTLKSSISNKTNNELVFFEKI